MPKMRLRHRALTCSRNCAKKRRDDKYNSTNPSRRGISCGTVGAISELRVATDLMSNGFHVFRALSPSCPCDLAIVKGSKLVRVEVTSGTLTIYGKKTQSALKLRRLGIHFELLAHVYRDGTIEYIPPLAEMEFSDIREDSIEGPTTRPPSESNGS